MLKILKIVAFFLILVQSSIEAIYRPPSVHDAVWQIVETHIIPDTHPVKGKLDQVFSSPNILNSTETMRKAGFKIVKERREGHCYVAFHKKLKGYVIKFYCDQQINNDWDHWMRRINGAKAIAGAIERHGVQHLFCVPKKWIYPVFRNSDNPGLKNFVLVAEEMQVYDGQANLDLWKQTKWMNKEKLTLLQKIISEEGLIDSIYPDNLPFCTDKRICFIDTEHSGGREIRYHRLTRYLPKKLQGYWTEMTHGQ